MTREKGQKCLDHQLLMLLGGTAGSMLVGTGSETLKIHN